MTGAPDDCPFHNLDPTTTVWVDFGGATLPYSPELACDDFHFSVAMQPTVDAALATVHAAIAEQGHDDAPPAFRKEQQ